MVGSAVAVADAAAVSTADAAADSAADAAADAAAVAAALYDVGDPARAQVPLQNALPPAWRNTMLSDDSYLISGSSMRIRDGTGGTYTTYTLV